MEQARNIFGVDSEETAGLVGDDCQWHSKVEIGASELDLGTMKRHGGSEGDSVSAAVVGDDFGSRLCDGVILLVGSAAWWWLSTLLFSIWRFEVVDLNFFFFGWNLYSLFPSRNGLICGNCKDLVRHTWSVAHSGLYWWLGRRVDQSG